MKVFRFQPPYKPTGKTTHPEARQRSGVYLIKENGKLVYVGFSAKNLYKTMYRHFEAWNHNSQQVISYKNKLARNKYTVRVIYCTPQQAYRLEKALIMKHKPRDNENKYTAYELDLKDQQVIKVYQQTPVTEEVPF